MQPGWTPARRCYDVPPMRLTIADIARAAGVSTATVDRVLNERAGVHARTRQRVTSAAQRLGYLDGESAPPAAAPLDLAFIVPGGTNTFMGALSFHLQDAAANQAGARVHIERPEAFHAEELAATLRKLAAAADGVGLIAIDHPGVRNAIRDAAASGVRVITLVSDIGDVPRHGYVGLDNRAAGRLAGYLMGRFLRQAHGTVAVFAGSLLYRGHEERAIGFRRSLAEESGSLTLLETREMHDDVAQCYAEARALLLSAPDLAGIYNVGAGNRGIARALEEAGRSRDIVFIGHELTEHSRRFLLSGTMDAVIDQNPRQEAELALSSLMQAIRGGEQALRIPQVRAQAIFRENLPEL